MKSIHWVISLILTLGLSGTLLAQDDSIQIDEILVEGSATLLQLRARVENAQRAVFASYNLLNEDNYYDIRCRFETSTGSHIIERVCEPVFVARLQAAATQDLLDGFGNPAALQQQVREATVAMEANMLALTNEHPELLDQTREYMQLSDEYDQLKDEHCAGKFFCWLNAPPSQ